MLQFIMMIVFGIIVLYIGYLIIRKNLLNFIIGYSNLSMFRNEKSYAISMGVLTLITGGIIIGFSIAKYFYGDIANKIFLPIGVVLLILFLIVDNIWRLKYVKITKNK